MNYVVCLIEPKSVKSGNTQKSGATIMRETDF